MEEKDLLLAILTQLSRIYDLLALALSTAPGFEKTILLHSQGKIITKEPLLDSFDNDVDIESNQNPK